MKHFITALAILATPAAASTVALDPGDRGLVWTAEGFRPVDGIDVFTGKFSCPRVGPAWKNMAQDRVMRATRCDEPPTPVWVADEPQPHYSARVAPVPRSYDPPPVVRIYTPLHPPIHCCGESTPPSDPPRVPPVPLPATAWLTAIAMGMLWAIRKRPLVPQSGSPSATGANCTKS